MVRCFPSPQIWNIQTYMQSKLNIFFGKSDIMVICYLYYILTMLSFPIMNRQLR